MGLDIHAKLARLLKSLGLMILAGLFCQRGRMRGANEHCGPQEAVGGGQREDGKAKLIVYFVL